MLYGMYLSTGGMMQLRHRLDVIANNMANVETTGFKRDQVFFKTRAAESAKSPGLARYGSALLQGIGGGALVSPTLTEFAQGEVEMTGNKLDVCLKGQGFLEVRVGNETRYTRDGHLTLDKDGLLITADDGYPVLNGDGQPIQVDPSQDIVIKADGQICQNGTPVAQLKVVQFDHLQALKKVGDNLYVNEAKAASHAAPANLIVGALERSSVDPVTELVAMIETQRAYEANAQMIRLQDGMLGTVINGLTQNM